MCLYTKQRHPKVAEKDIVVYKVLDQRMGSPYYGLLYPLNEKRTSILKNYDWKWEEAGHKVYDVEEGLHAYTKRMAAYVKRHYLNRCDSEKDFTTYSVYKAIIPKGAKYYIGLDNDIASDALIVKRKLWLNLF